MHLDQINVGVLQSVLKLNKGKSGIIYDITLHGLHWVAVISAWSKNLKVLTFANAITVTLRNGHHAQQVSFWHDTY